MNDDSIRQRRENNLRAMRSPASFTLAGLTVVAMICATVFHDRQISSNTAIFSYFRAAPSTAAPGGG
jgi:hypothetical protein